MNITGAWREALVTESGSPPATDGSFADLSMDWRTVESVETVRGTAAVALYGDEAFAGVVLISLKETLAQG